MGRRRPVHPVGLPILFLEGIGPARFPEINPGVGVVRGLNDFLMERLLCAHGCAHSSGSDEIPIWLKVN